jgi:hypothetical protein
MAIKTTLVPPQNKAKEIDWNKRQIVHNNEYGILLATGKHSGTTFEGIVLYEIYDVGLFKTDWFKENFTPITTPITITFEND